MRGKDAAGLFHFGAAGAVFSTSNGVLDHGVGDDQGHGVRNGGEAIAEVAAVEQERVAGRAVGGDELVHDAAVCADKLIFRALAEAGQEGARDGDAEETGDRGGGGHLDRGGAGEAGAERDIAPQAEAERRNGVAFAGEDGEDAEGIVAPVSGSFCGQFGGRPGAFCAKRTIFPSSRGEMAARVAKSMATGMTKPSA